MLAFVGAALVAATAARDIIVLAAVAAGLRAGAAVLLITHDLALAGEYCDRVVVMHAGHVVEVAPAHDVAEITSLAAATVAWEYLALLGAADGG